MRHTPVYKYLSTAMLIGGIATQALAQSDLTGTQADGYRGIWFTLNQFYEYGDKYSGGLGTYTAKHKPLAIYAPEVEKTFFVYGGTTGTEERHLLCMVGSYDHRDSTVSRPTVVYDKRGVDDPHDNPSLLIDPEGYLWVFVSGRNTRRPGFKFKSRQPYSIEAFEQITQEEMTYPQAWYVDGRGFFHFFTKYTGVRELYYETSEDGKTWSEDQKLAGIKSESEEKSGHYQVSGRFGDTLATFFSRHPNGNVDKRTNLYYLQSTDFGQTWTTAEGQEVSLPVTEVSTPARVIDYESQGKNVYLKDVNFDEDGNPVCLYITSAGHEPGPDNDPREWRVTHYDGARWNTHVITTSDHNYDMGSLRIDGSTWAVIAPTTNSPQRYGGGGEVVHWISSDQGKSWKKARQITQDSPRNHNYVRRIIHGRAPFLYFWADGNPDTLSPSYLYFGDGSEQYWQLPYTMEKEKEKPLIYSPASSSVSISTDFEGGTLGDVTRISENHWQCALSGESDSENRNRQASWYYFRVAGSQDQPLTIDLTDLVGEYNYNYGSHPVTAETRPVISYDQTNWRHLMDAEVQWNPADTTLTLTFTPEKDTVWVAHIPPYTTEPLQQLLSTYRSHPSVAFDTLGHTPEERSMLLMTVTNPNVPIDQKRVVWLMARQHSWEAGTSYVMDGAIRYLLDSVEGQQWLDRIVFKLIPMGDPDGVARGGVRFNAFGHDLNRNWDYVIPEEMPEIHAQKTAIENWRAQGYAIDLFLTLHNTESADYVQGPDVPVGQKLWKELVDHSSFEAPEGLREMPESTTLGKRGRMTVNQALWAELQIPAYLMELKVEKVDKLNGRRSVDDWKALGPKLIEAIAVAVE